MTRLRYLLDAYDRSRLRVTPIHGFALSGPATRLSRQNLDGVTGRVRRLALISMAFGSCWFTGAPAGAQQDTVRVMPPSRVCEAGVITGIDVVRGSVFDPDSTDISALAWTYRLMNVVHIRTQESFIRREILLEEGDCSEVERQILAFSKQHSEEQGAIIQLKLEHSFVVSVKQIGRAHV